MEDQLLEAAGHVLRVTNTPWAPWVVVDGSDDRYRMLQVASVILGALLKRLADLQDQNFPVAPPMVPNIDQLDVLTALDHRGCQTGFGADDKAGVFVCLNLLEQCENIKAVFFAAEECGCVGARNALPQFFDDVAYVIEYDCPSRQMLSYSVGGVRLFSNGGSFIQEALPVLNHYGTVHWQHHPYTDVMALRLRFPVSCFNLSCGYYNWHASSEYVKISDVAHAVEQGCTLVETISRRQHSCPVRLLEDVSPHRSITGLRLPEFA